MKGIQALLEEDDVQNLKKFHLSALARATVAANDAQRESLVQNFHFLNTFVRILACTDIMLVNDTVIALNNLILAGARRNDSETRHPFLSMMEQCGGIDALSVIFNNQKIK